MKKINYSFLNIESAKQSLKRRKYLFYGMLTLYIITTSILGLLLPKTHLSAPSLLSPIEREIIQNKNIVQFEWTSVPNAEKYKIEVSTNENFSDLLVDQTVSDNNYSKLFQFNKKYYWRVLALNNKNTSDWSTKSEFTIFRVAGPYTTKEPSTEETLDEITKPEPNRNDAGENEPVKEPIRKPQPTKGWGTHTGNDDKITTETNNGPESGKNTPYKEISLSDTNFKEYGDKKWRYACKNQNAGFKVTKTEPEKTEEIQVIVDMETNKYTVKITQDEYNKLRKGKKLSIKLYR